MNPAPDVVDSLIHELIHRLRPEWKEAYVRGRTTRILRSITPQELDAIYTMYLANVKRRKSVIHIEDV